MKTPLNYQKFIETEIDSFDIIYCLLLNSIEKYEKLCDSTSVYKLDLNNWIYQDDFDKFLYPLLSLFELTYLDKKYSRIVGVLNQLAAESEKFAQFLTSSNFTYHVIVCSFNLCAELELDTKKYFSLYTEEDEYSIERDVINDHFYLIIQLLSNTKTFNKKLENLINSQVW